MLEYTVKVFDDRTEWYLDGKLHREDGPAIEDANGDREWWLSGERHRVDGPAIERADGSGVWWVDGRLHREDGPAVEFTDGFKVWYVNGKKVSEEDVIGVYAGEIERDQYGHFDLVKGSNTEEVLPEVLVINGIEYCRN